MDLSIITVNTNDKEKIIDQIRSAIAGAEGLSFEQIISDNGSSDGSVEEIRRQFPQVQVVENGKNVGFGAANNSALPFAHGEFVLFLNPDMRVEKGSLTILIDWMRTHPDVGIASCALKDSLGKIQMQALPRRFPTLFDQIMILLKIPHLFPSVLNRYLYHGFDPNKEQNVDSVRGSFLLTRREILATLVWAFDPRYFIWFEDVDLCKEVRRLGWRIVYTPIISCVDYVGQTFRRVPLFRKQVWMTKSMVIYFQKWHPWYVWVWVWLLRPFVLLLAWMFSRQRENKL